MNVENMSYEKDHVSALTSKKKTHVNLIKFNKAKHKVLLLVGGAPSINVR